MLLILILLSYKKLLQAMLLQLAANYTETASIVSCANSYTALTWYIVEVEPLTIISRHNDALSTEDYTVFVSINQLSQNVLQLSLSVLLGSLHTPAAEYIICMMVMMMIVVVMVMVMTAAIWIAALMVVVVMVMMFMFMIVMVLMLMLMFMVMVMMMFVIMATAFWIIALMVMIVVVMMVLMLLSLYLFYRQKLAVSQCI